MPTPSADDFSIIRQRQLELRKEAEAAGAPPDSIDDLWQQPEGCKCKWNVASRKIDILIPDCPVTHPQSDVNTWA